MILVTVPEMTRMSRKVEKFGKAGIAETPSRRVVGCIEPVPLADGGGRQKRVGG